jgi:hypothetical protein
MKVYTISGSHVTVGAVLDSYSLSKPAEQRTLHLGDYSTNSKHIPMFKKNVPVIDIANNLPYGGIITNAYPVKLDDGYALANPNQESEHILVVIRMGTRTERRRCVRIGTWSFDSSTVPTPEAIRQTLAQGEGSATFEDGTNGWQDALIIMKVGDSLTLYERTGDIARVKYESVETGLVVDTKVRMVLQDYDAAPDGVGTYTKLDAEFPSRYAALQYRERYMHNMYWGKITAPDGTLIEHVEERNDR